MTTHIVRCNFPGCTEGVLIRYDPAGKVILCRDHKAARHSMMVQQANRRKEAQIAAGLHVDGVSICDTCRFWGACMDSLWALDHARRRPVPLACQVDSSDYPAWLAEHPGADRPQMEMELVTDLR
jgi:hypothetical protein